MRVLWAAALFLLVPSAQAEPRKLAILADVLGGDASGAEPFLDAIRERAASYLDLQVVSAAGSGYLAADVRRCGSDVACAREKLIESGVDHVLRVLANASVSPAMVSLQLVSVSTSARTKLEMVEDEQRAPEAAAAACAEMLDGLGFEVGGRLDVEVTPPDAKVRVSAGDEALESVPALLRPGTYSVAAEHEGYSPKTVNAIVRSGATERVTLTLDPEESWTSNPWVWVGAGLVVVGTVVAVSILASGPTTYELCQTSDPSQCR